MSVTITTTFNHNGAFFAGEKFSCTIAFTNSLPFTPQSQRKNPAIFLQPIEETPADLAGAQDIGRLTPSKPLASRTRSSSDPLKDLPAESAKGGDQKSSTLFVATPMVKSASSSDFSTSMVRKPLSLTSLAMYTMAYFTGGDKEAPLQVSSEPRRRLSNPYEKQHGEPVTGLVNLHTTELSKVILESDPLLDDSTPRSSLDFSSNSDVLSRSSLDSSRPSHHRGSLKPSITSTQIRRTETLLWSFAQVVGSFVVDSSVLNAAEFEVLKSRTMYRPLNGSSTGGAVGGGSLTMFGSGLNGMGHITTSDEKNLPVFSTPPSILFVDLQLAPGETKTFSYDLLLPSDLPPSHRGKSIRFNYNLIISTQRAAPDRPSHVVQLPFRIFNHISEDGSRPIYDLMNPVILYRDEAIVKTIQDKAIATRDDSELQRDFLQYVDELVASNAGNNLSLLSPEITPRETDPYITSASQEVKSCINTINMITRPYRKAFYDICKNNERVAQLYLTKTAYRLGEVVMGIIYFVDSAVPSYQVSVTLESSELVEQTISLRPVQQISRASRKRHAEHHEFCLNMSRTSFALCIPPSASPEFFTTGVRLQWHIRLEFIIGNAQDHPIAPVMSDDRHNHNQAVQEVAVNTFDCAIPIKVFPAEVGDVRGFNTSSTVSVT